MAKSKHVELARLLGFETLDDHVAGPIDFQDETIGDKLGAKVGEPEPNAPAGEIDHAPLLGF